jgi:hypothetical protein
MVLTAQGQGGDVLELRTIASKGKVIADETVPQRR